MGKNLQGYGFPENYSKTSKSDVLSFLLTENSRSINNLISERLFKTHFTELYHEMLDRFKELDFPFAQKLYHFLREDYDFKLIGKCEICGNSCKFVGFHLGYLKTCSKTCNYKLSKINCIKTKKEKYGNENYNNHTKCKETKLKRYGNENYNNQAKCKETKKEKYGDENYNNPNKAKSTNLIKYGNENYNNRSLASKTCMERYGVDNFEKSAEGRKKQADYWANKSDDEMLEFKNNCKKYWENLSDDEKTKHSEKIFESRKNNHTINTSKIEEEFAQYLIENNINFIRQYRDDRYSHNGYKFCCDFYLPDYDLFIEIQGSWTHGKHPFDETNPNDIIKLNTWKSRGTNYYTNAIQVWTIKDPLKRKIAKENGLNYLEIFSHKIDEVIKEFSKLHKI